MPVGEASEVYDLAPLLVHSLCFVFEAEDVASQLPAPGASMPASLP